MSRATHIGGWAAALAVLALVFAWYLQPDVVVALALQVWSCF
jgi:hypothetical protein